MTNEKSVPYLVSVHNVASEYLDRDVVQANEWTKNGEGERWDSDLHNIMDSRIKPSHYVVCDPPQKDTLYYYYEFLRICGN
jgi:hypothetical protein